MGMLFNAGECRADLPLPPVWSMLTMSLLALFHILTSALYITVGMCIGVKNRSGGQWLACSGSSGEESPRLRPAAATCSFII